MTPWADIPGVTAVSGRARLPRHPDVTVHALATALRAATDGLAAPAVHACMASNTATLPVGADDTDPDRLAGLAGWLPLSHVLHWRAHDGVLAARVDTDLVDLTARFAAWVGAQPVANDLLETRDRFTDALQAAAAAHPHLHVAQSALASPPPPADAPAPHTSVGLLNPDVPARVQRLLTALDGAFLERRPQARAALLALLAGRHVLLLGPPGTAKSLLARALCQCFTDAPYFEYLLSRFTHPDELFGPVSIPGLKEEDYRRLTDGYLPSAGVAFLDEVFKANSAILNSLLTLINEGLFHHGRHRDAVPLIGLIGASNEGPRDDSLAALYDRFLVRLAVPPLATASAFLAVATGDLAPLDTLRADALSAEDRRQIAAASARVTVPDDVQETLVALWRDAADRDWGMSDRRWRHAVSLLRVAAATAGRDTVEPLDLLLLAPILAPSPGHAADARDVLVTHLSARGVPAHDLRAQWLLLGQDRVAPPPDAPPLPVAGDDWPSQLQRRHASAKRFLQRCSHAVDRLAQDRAALQARGDAHPWIDHLPPRLLGTHVRAARDLAALLDAGERYAERVSSPARLVAGLLGGLPERPKRFFGQDVACVLIVPDAELRVGLTQTADRVSADIANDDTARVTATVADLLDWLHGARTTRSLLTHASTWGERAAHTALTSLRTRCGGQVVPRPPPLPRPS